MSILQTNIIDAMGYDPESRCTRLAVIDHLDWNEPLEHIFLLQEKLNCYLAFIESGELFDSYPAALETRIGIEVIFQHEPCNDDAQEFLSSALNTIKAAGFEFRWKVFAEKTC